MRMPDAGTDIRERVASRCRHFQCLQHVAVYCAAQTPIIQGVNIRSRLHAVALERPVQGLRQGPFLVKSQYGGCT
jgi:hypothetical protein